MITSTEFLEQNYNKFDTRAELTRACMDASGIAKPTALSQVSRFLKRKGWEFNGKKTGDGSTPDVLKPTPLSEANLRNKHDYKFMLVQALNNIKPGEYWTREDFIKLSNVPVKEFRRLIAGEEFEDYIGKAANVTYIGTKDDIKKMRDEGILE